MNLDDIDKRPLPPAPWAEGENIPWSDPEFSHRMLAEHLNQGHDRASRRFETIDRQVDWIHRAVLDGTPTRILELTCGPGLYTSRLAKRGHTCVGIDYAPASIRYAQQTATRDSLACTYQLHDVREADYGAGYGLVMMVNGQFNVFRSRQARTILEKTYAALLPGGSLLLEPQRFSTVESTGRSGTAWYSCGESGGLFHPGPHLCVTESFWHAEAQAATQRFYVIDTRTGQVTPHAMTTEAYTDEQVRAVLTGARFGNVRFFPSLVGVEVEDEGQSFHFVAMATKEPSPVGGILGNTSR